MRKLVLATAALTLMCGSALAQGTTGPASQGDNMTKPGMTNGTMDRDRIERRGTMEDRTTGMDRGRMPDASGQGGSGPNSDQGGTRVAPNNMK